MIIEINNINPNKIHDQLISRGIVPLYVESNLIEGEYIAEKTWITFDAEVNVDLVNSIIDAHVPTPLPTAPTVNERIDMLENMILLIMEG